MVETVGATPLTASTVVARVAATQPVAAVSSATTQTAVAAETASSSTALSNVARQLSTSAPVDTDRVSKIKKAIQEGKFPLLPTTIADRLLALKLQWDGNEQA